MQTIRRLSEPFFGPATAALGFFDGVHLAHRAVIGEALAARRDGEKCVVFSFAVANCRPQGKHSAAWLMAPEQKEKALAALGVDCLLEPPFEEICSLTPAEYADYLLTHLHVSAVSCGYDYRFGKNAAGTAKNLKQLLEPHGVQVITVPAVLDGGKPVSSSRIRKLLLAGAPEEAARLLGAPFALTSPVVHGIGLGHRLGFPTANQRFVPGMLVPRHGVYATRVTVGDTAYPAVTDVGVKPTVRDSLPGAESCLLGFSGDLYGEQVKTEFLHFLREERKFDSLEELTAQIARDAETVEKQVK